jgi:putative transposase
MIERNNPLTIVKQASAAGISRASVYYVLRPISPTDLALIRRIDELHLQHPIMGARQLRRELLKAGIDVGRRHIRTLIKRLDIEAQCPQPGTSKAAPGHKSGQQSNPVLSVLALVTETEKWLRRITTTGVP